MGTMMHNESGTLNPNASLFDFELPKSNITEAEMKYSSFDDFGLGKIFEPIKDDVKRHLQLMDPYFKFFFELTAPACPEKAFFVHDAKEFHNIYDDQRFDIIKYRDMIINDLGKTPRSPCTIIHTSAVLVMDREGMTSSCSPSNMVKSASKPDKLHLIKIDISIIKRELMSFLLIFRLCGFMVRNRDEIQAFVDITEVKIIDLIIYWKNHLSMTVELNKQINIILNNNSKSLSRDIAELHSMFAEIKQRLIRVQFKYQNILIMWSMGEELIEDIGMKFEGLGDNSNDRENQNSEYSESDSESITSNSDSESDMSNSDFGSAMSNSDFGSAMSNSDSESVISNSDSERSSESCDDDDKSEAENLLNTNMIDDTAVAVVAQQETIVVETPQDSQSDNVRFRLNKWIFVMLFLIALFILWLFNWLEPQCSDEDCSCVYKLSFNIVYLNGPPPT